MPLLTSPEILRAENQFIALLDRTFQKATKTSTLDYKKELPRNVKRWFNSATFQKQLDSILTSIIVQSLLYADGQMKRMQAASLKESTVLTTEAVNLSQELGGDVAKSIIRILDEDAIYYEHPNALAGRIQDLWGGERYRAVRFARTFTADVATASTVHRYRQYGVRYMEFDAELDDRTTDQCRCLDGVQFDLEKGSVDAYRPPLHMHCFPAGTLVNTYHTDKRIEDIRIGDMVLTHEGRYMPVTCTMSRIPDRIIEISTRNRTVRITPNHPVWHFNYVKGGFLEWLQAGDLVIGNRIVTLRGYEIIERIVEAHVEPVYNISVDEDESYTANGIIVHNCRSGLKPLADTELKEDMIFENRDFSTALDDPEKVDRAFKNIDTFNEKYRVSKYVIDHDIATRILLDKGMSVGLDVGAEETAKEIIKEYTWVDM